MTIDIQERDVDARLCTRCAACCRIRLKLANTDSRYRRFLRQIGYRVLPLPKEGETDCCDGRHDASVDLGYCRNLEVGGQEDDRRFFCRIHETDALPDLCRQFNCVSWAKANDRYNERNTLLVAAQSALDAVRRFGPDPGADAPQ